MKFKTEEKIAGKTVLKEIFWGDHAPACERCREVDLQRPATFVHACACPGAQLLDEVLRKRQAPVVRENAKQVREWAEKAGFDTRKPVGRATLDQITLFVGDDRPEAGDPADS